MNSKHGPEHKTKYVQMKNEQGKPFSPEQQVSLSLWDPTESDTESLFQERAYQLELQRRIDCSEESMTQEEEDEKEVENDEEDLHVDDSLQVAARLRLVKRNSRASPIEVHGTQESGGKEVSRQTHASDIYADLRYDPNWRTNLQGAHLLERTQLLLEKGSHNSDDKSKESHSEGEETFGTVRYRYTNARSPTNAESMTPKMTGSEFKSDHPLTSYHLHPLHNQAIKVVSPASPYYLHEPQNQALGDTIPELTPDVPSERGVDRNSHREVKAGGMAWRNQSYARENEGISPGLEEHYREIHDRHTREVQLYYVQEQGQTSGTFTRKQSMCSTLSKSKGSGHLSDRKPEKPRKDIIEHNKITLGINTVRKGSYLREHAQKAEKSDTPNPVLDTTEDITIGGSQEESQEDNSDPEQRWLQKTQQLKVTQRRENPKPPTEKRPPIQRSKAKQRDYMSTPTHRPAARTLPNPHLNSHPHSHHRPQHFLPPQFLLLSDTDSRCILDTPPHPRPRLIPLTQPPPPTVPLSTNLNTSAELLPLQRQNRQDTGITLMTPGANQCKSMPDMYNATSTFMGGVRVALSLPHVSTGQMAPVPLAAVSPGRSTLSQGSRVGSNTEPHLWHHENAPGGWQGHHGPRLIASSQLNLNQSPNEEHIVLQYEESPRPAYTAQTQHSESYAVLPPIGKVVTGDPERISDRTAQKINNSIQRSSSEGYLAQMLKHKQLKESVMYKAYTLKDYKRLKQDVNLGGLGPDYTTEMTAEKMRRQKLYSNVIREQNKKITRIPFLPARNLVGSDKEDTVPRRKALEYARSIPRPKVPSQPKPRERENSEGFVERARYLDGLHLPQLATLELLRKRHEEEKQAVARLRVVHAV